MLLNIKNMKCMLLAWWIIFLQTKSYRCCSSSSKSISKGPLFYLTFFDINGLPSTHPLNFTIFSRINISRENIYLLVFLWTRNLCQQLFYFFAEAKTHVGMHFIKHLFYIIIWSENIRLNMTYLPLVRTPPEVLTYSVQMYCFFVLLVQVR